MLVDGGFAQRSDIFVLNDSLTVSYGALIIRVFNWSNEINNERNRQLEEQRRKEAKEGDSVMSDAGAAAEVGGLPTLSVQLQEQIEMMIEEETPPKSGKYKKTYTVLMPYGSNVDPDRASDDDWWQVEHQPGSTDP